MERLTNQKEADSQRKAYERRLGQGYPRNIPEERYLRLAAYEDTGLEPEEIIRGKELAGIACALYLLKKYQALGTIEELCELVKAQEEGRLEEIYPCDHCFSGTYRGCEGCGYNPETKAKAAMKGAEQ